MYNIYPRQYYGNKTLTQFNMREGCVYILDGAFATSSLSSIKIASTVKVIGKYAFSGLLQLKTIEIPEGVREIGDMAFTGCMQLKKVVLPASITYLGKYLFYGCNMLERIELPQSTYELMQNSNREMLHLCVVTDAETPEEAEAEVFEEANIEAVPMEVENPKIFSETEIDDFEVASIPEEIERTEDESKVTEPADEAENLDIQIAKPEIEDEFWVEELESEDPEVEALEVDDAEDTIDLIAWNAEGDAAAIVHRMMKGEKNVNLAVLLNMDDAEIDSYDISIEKMELSRRAFNWLMRAGIQNLSAILRLNSEDFLRIRNLGKKSMEEILNAALQYVWSNNRSLKKWIGAGAANHDASAFGKQSENGVKLLEALLNCEHLRYVHDIAAQYGAALSKQQNSEFVQKMFALWRDMPASSEEIQAFGAVFFDSPVYESMIHTQILQLVNASQCYGMTKEEIAEKMPDERTKVQLKEMLEALLQSGELRCIKGRFVPNCMTLQEWLDQNQEDKKTVCLKKRLQGLTLQQVAEEMGITRERVRQICAGMLRKLKKSGIVLYEERYVLLYEKYHISAEEIRIIFSEPVITTEYLKCFYKNGNLPLEAALEDEALPQDMRNKIAEYLAETDETITLDGEKYPLERQALMEYVLKKYCGDTLSVDEYVDVYNAFLREQGIDDAKLRISEENYRYFETRLANSHKLLWGLNRRMRYYDIDGKDYANLLQTLALGAYLNIEISTRLLMNLHPELMVQYDIRDEYELHNLLKKIHAESENSTLEFVRMPMLHFGDFDRDTFVLEVLIDCAPCDKDTLVKEIEKRTGVLPETIGAVWLPCLNDYYHMGVYSIDAPAMPTHLAEALRAALCGEAYTMDEVQQIYRRVSGGADESYLNPYNLKQLGFNVYSKLVIANAENANDYFTRKLTEQDVVDSSELQKRFGSINTYTSILNKLKDDYDVIEFAPNHLIQIRKLRSFGIDKADLHAFCDEVEQATEIGEIFSLKSLRDRNMEFELDALGFDDMFLESLLREDHRFRFGKFGGCIIFCQTTEDDRSGLMRGDLLKWMMRECDSMDIDDLIYDIRDLFGCSLDRADIQAASNQVGFYWDKIMERVYKDYEIYYSEV